MFTENLFIKLPKGLPICNGVEAFFWVTEPALLLFETLVGLNAVVGVVVKKDVTTVCGFLHVTCENLTDPKIDQLSESRTAVNVPSNT